MAEKRSPIDRFTEKVDFSGDCWIWTGGKDWDGYAIFKVEKRSVRGHRWIYEQVVGPIPDGLSLCHQCDTPSCVRPGHLFLGTLLDNNRDRDAKGRTASGEDNSQARLTEENVRSIRALSQSGVTHREIAQQFGCSETNVSFIVNGKTWARVT